MKYGKECKHNFTSEVGDCSTYSNGLRNVNDDDKVFIISVTPLEKERIRIVMEDNGIETFEVKNDKRRNLFVQTKDYETAVKILRKIEAFSFDNDYEKESELDLVKSEIEKEKFSDLEKIINDLDEVSQTDKKTQKIGIINMSLEDYDKKISSIFGFKTVTRGKRWFADVIFILLFLLIIFGLIKLCFFLLEVGETIPELKSLF